VPSAEHLDIGARWASDPDQVIEMDTRVVSASVTLVLASLLLPVFPLSAQSAPEVVFVKGKIKDEFTRPKQPLRGVEVCNREGNCVFTNRKGQFKKLPILVDPDNYPGYYKLIAKHEDCHPHRFWVRVNKKTASRKTTLWATTDVPLECLNLQWRWKGWPRVTNGEGGSVRWMSEPENIIVLNRIECLERDPVNRGCGRFRIREEKVTQAFRDRVRAFVALWPEYTRRLKGDRIREVEYTAGEVFDLSDVLSVPGSITWMSIDRFEWAGFAMRMSDSSGALIAVAVEVRTSNSSLYVVEHEGWHALGASHMGVGAHLRIEQSCPRSSMMGMSTRITEDDIATARAVYSRPSGSKRPDKDPNPEKWLQALMLAEGTELYVDTEVCDLPVGSNRNTDQ